MTRTEWREWIQAVLMPVAVAAAGYWVAKSNATRETSAQYVGKAMDILAHDTAHADRVWAAKVLARYSEVPFSAGAESMLVRVGPGLFAEVVGRQFNRLLVCDSVGHNCRPMVIEKPLPITEVPGPIIVSPKSITIRPGQTADFTAYGRMSTGDRVSVTVTWRATGGGITAEGGFPAYARYTAPSVPGDYVVIASSSGGADTAFVHVQS